MNIVFMGTPDFADYCLQKLLEKKYSIIAAVTVPDKPAGRGKKIQMSPVKETALKAGIPVLQPDNLKSEDFIESLKTLNPDLFIVVAFRMLPKIVWSLPKSGTFNLHASLLPDYRGAAPINHAIINGETKTGVTTFFIDEKIDTGRIIFRKEIDIFPEDNAGSLHDKLMILGAELIGKTIESISNSDFVAVSQDELLSTNSEIKYAPKIFKDFMEINWSEDVQKIHNLVRGLSPYPVARTIFTDNETEKEIGIKIFETEPIIFEHHFEYGEIISDNKTEIKIAGKNGFLKIISLQPEGKKRMNVKDFLNGFDILKIRIKKTH